MAIRVGINGFGRIGRNLYRTSMGDNDIEIVAVNDITDPKTLAHLLKYDSVLGNLKSDVKPAEDSIVVDGKSIKVFKERDPGKIDWPSLGVDVVVESTGLFTNADDARKHMRGSVKKVIISAPAKGEDITVCLGVNDSKYDKSIHNIVSNASCTTNCLAPLAKVLHESFGIESGLMNTVHAYTSDQQLQDQAVAARSGKPDLRRMRAAALSIIPNSTGAAKAIGKLLPDLNGKLDGMSLRVPTPTGSITDLVAVLKTAADKDAINDAFRAASNDASYRGVLEYTDETLVSADIVGNPSSCIFSAPDTMSKGNLVKVLGWYDNEWGYSNRLVDLVDFV